MSLLSSTRGTPERVWSLVSALAVNQGCLGRDEADALLNPAFTRGGDVVKQDPTAFAQTLSAATSLGIVGIDQATLRLRPGLDAADFNAFGDWVHDRLIALDSGEKDAVILETYAWVAVESDRQRSTGWMNDWTTNEFADAANQSLPEGADDDGERRINTTKLSRWRDWLISLGLMVPLPVGERAWLPSATARAARELARMDLPRDEAIEATAFLAALATRLPYLDGGSMFEAAMRRQVHTKATSQLSPILSACLRDIYDDGLIELNVLGDTGAAVTLWRETTHTIKAFDSVVMREVA